MTARQIRTRDVPRSDYQSHQNKAAQFLRTMKSAIEEEDWDAASLNAVHCAISAADALIIHRAGVRSASEVHSDTVALLTQHVKDDQVKPKSKSLSKILAYKHVAAYEGRELTGADAQKLTKLTERFYDWATSLLK